MSAILAGDDLHDVSTAEAFLLHLLHSSDLGQGDEGALLLRNGKERKKKDTDDMKRAKITADGEGGVVPFAL